MAKAKTLAALAGLAGLAYAMRNKDEGMTPEQNDTLANANRVSRMSDDSDTLARMNREKTPGQGAVDDTNASVLNAITASNTSDADNTTANAYPLGVMGGETQYKPPSKPAVKPQDKRNIVSKKQMDDYKSKFGQDKTLRDYMNSQRASKNEPIKPISLPDSYKRGGAVKMASGGMTASRRGDGIAQRGKTRGKMC